MCFTPVNNQTIQTVAQEMTKTAREQLVKASKGAVTEDWAQRVAENMTARVEYELAHELSRQGYDVEVPKFSSKPEPSFA